jgi:creatinine amidohydrolase
MDSSIINRIALPSLTILLLFLTGLPVITADTESRNAASCSGTASPSHNWGDQTTAMLSASPPRVALFPLGSIEQHGPHLPLSTDLLLANAFADVSSSKTALRLPASPFGASMEHLRFSGTLAISDSPLNGLWKDVISSVAAAGVLKIILLNAHGGQSPNTAVVSRDARFQSDPPVLVVVINIQAVIHDAAGRLIADGAFPDLVEMWLEESTFGIHGGLIETALILHLHPQLVNMTLARHFEPRPSARGDYLEPYGHVVSYGWEAQDLSKDGALGDASLATAEFGRAIFEIASAYVKAAVDEISTLETNVSSLLVP